MEIEFKNVNFSINDEPILTDVSFQVQHGGSRVMLGASGSGKTTILRLLLGLQRPSSGSILVDGVDLAQASEKVLNRTRKRMAIVFQYGALFDSLSVRENVSYRLLEEGMLTTQEIDQVVHEALCFVGMPEAIDKRPFELSGGMRKRVGIARALASGAECILFDEPTAGLDPINANNVTALIMRLRDEPDFCCIDVTHDLEHAFRVASRIALLDRGEIIFEGTADEMRQSTEERVVSFVKPKQGDQFSCDISAILEIPKRRMEKMS